MSFSKLALFHEAQADKAAMCEALEQGLVYALAFQDIMPYDDAANVVGWFRSKLEVC